jgi:hypothetical protein
MFQDKEKSEKEKAEITANLITAITLEKKVEVSEAEIKHWESVIRVQADKLAKEKTKLI